MNSGVEHPFSWLHSSVHYRHHAVVENWLVRALPRSSLRQYPRRCCCRCLSRRGVEVAAGPAININDMFSANRGLNMRTIL
jgi:hypothetical protein